MHGSPRMERETLTDMEVFISNHKIWIVHIGNEFTYHILSLAFYNNKLSTCN